MNRETMMFIWGFTLTIITSIGFSIGFQSIVSDKPIYDCLWLTWVLTLANFVGVIQGILLINKAIHSK